MPKRVAVVLLAGALLAADRVPHEARRIDHRPIDDGARHVAEQTDRELDDAHRHGLVLRIGASHDQQHAAHLGRRMHEDEEREQRYEGHVALAGAVTVAGDRLEFRICVGGEDEIVHFCIWAWYSVWNMVHE